MQFKFNFKQKKQTLKDIYKPNKKYGKRFSLIILTIIAIAIFFSGISLGKTIHESTLKSSVSIAKPILEVEKDSEIVITQDNKKGEYHFKVKNYNESEEISQVDLKYYIEILEDDLDPSITYELYNENEKIDLKDNKTDEMNFNRNIKEEHNYTLKVEHDSSKNQIRDILQDIQIKVHSEQLKI